MVARDAAKIQACHKVEILLIGGEKVGADSFALSRRHFGAVAIQLRQRRTLEDCLVGDPDWSVNIE